MLERRALSFANTKIRIAAYLKSMQLLLFTSCIAVGAV